jgi:hypothetical protein
MLFSGESKHTWYLQPSLIFWVSHLFVNLWRHKTIFLGCFSPETMILRVLKLIDARSLYFYYLQRPEEQFFCSILLLKVKRFSLFLLISSFSLEVQRTGQPFYGSSTARSLEFDVFLESPSKSCVVHMLFDAYPR